MSRFPNSMERMAQEGSRRSAEVRAKVQAKYKEWLDWATQGLPEGANLSLAEAYFAGWYERHRAPVTESMAALSSPPVAWTKEIEGAMEVLGRFVQPYGAGATYGQGQEAHNIIREALVAPRTDAEAKIVYGVLSRTSLIDVVLRAMEGQGWGKRASLEVITEITRAIRAHFFKQTIDNSASETSASESASEAKPSNPSLPPEA